MATLRRSTDGALFPLAARTLVGRSAAALLRLPEAHVSGEHATLSWAGDRWEVRDLGSRNGTFVEGTRLEPGIARALDPGARLGFGVPQGWDLLDTAAPGAIAVDLATGALTASQDGLLVLPSAEAPLLSVFGDALGGWVVEGADGETRAVEDQGVVAAAGRTWRLSFPVVLEGTPMIEPGPSLETVRFRFAVSRNEEFVQLTVLFGTRELRLDPRDHHYVLLTLARLRREEQELPESERGWVERERLTRMLAMEPNALNVSIHRARQQLLAEGIERAAGIVEVRAGQRRFGTDRFQIVPL